MTNTVTLDLEIYNELYAKAKLYDEQKEEKDTFAKQIYENGKEIAKKLRELEMKKRNGGLD